MSISCPLEEAPPEGDGAGHRKHFRVAAIGVTLLLVAMGSLSWRLTQLGAIVRSTIPSQRTVETWCRGEIISNSLRTAGDSGRLTFVTSAHLGPVGDARQGQTSVVLVDRSTGAGWYCLLGDSGPGGYSGEAWTPLHGAIFGVLPLYAANTAKLGFYAVVV